MGSSTIGRGIMIEPCICACGRTAVPNDTGSPSYQSSAKRLGIDYPGWFWQNGWRGPIRDLVYGSRLGGMGTLGMIDAGGGARA